MGGQRGTVWNHTTDISERHNWISYRSYGLNLACWSTALHSRLQVTSTKYIQSGQSEQSGGQSAGQSEQLASTLARTLVGVNGS